MSDFLSRGGGVGATSLPFVGFRTAIFLQTWDSVCERCFNCLITILVVYGCFLIVYSQFVCIFVAEVGNGADREM